MLHVNTIEFDGREACINSYSDHPALTANRERQLREWQALFPNAIVRTELMSEADTRALVALKVSPHEVGEASR